MEKDGTLREVQIHDVRHGHYRNSLADSLKDMRFQPALCKGQAVTYEMDLPLEFAPLHYETPEERNHQMGCDMIGQCAQPGGRRLRMTIRLKRLGAGVNEQSEDVEI